MSTVEKADRRVLASELAVHAARRRISNAEREGKSQLWQLPAAVRDELERELALAKGNLHQARIAYAAVRRYPPLGLR